MDRGAFLEAEEDEKKEFGCDRGAADKQIPGCRGMSDSFQVFGG